MLATRRCRGAHTTLEQGRGIRHWSSARHDADSLLELAPEDVRGEVARAVEKSGSTSRHDQRQWRGVGITFPAPSKQGSGWRLRVNAGSEEYRSRSERLVLRIELYFSPRWCVTDADGRRFAVGRTGGRRLCIEGRIAHHPDTFGRL